MAELLQLIRFKQLQAAGIFGNRMALKRAIDSQGFPAPICLGANSRAWDYALVVQWLAQRPRGKGALPSAPQQQAEAGIA